MVLEDMMALRQYFVQKDEDVCPPYIMALALGFEAEGGQGSTLSRSTKTYAPSFAGLTLWGRVEGGGLRVEG